MLSLRIPKFRDEHYFGVFLVLFWGKDIVFNYVKAFILRIPYVKLTADYFLPVLMMFCIILSLSYVSKFVTPKDMLAFLIFTSFFIVSLALYPANRRYMLELSGNLFTIVLPLYMIGLCFDTEKHTKILNVVSIVNIWTFAAYTVMTGSNVSSFEATYYSSMHRAYVLLPQILLVLGQLLKKPDILKGITVVIGFVFLMMCGNRGSFLLFIVFIAAYLLFILEKKMRWYYYLGIGGLFALIMYFYDLLIGMMRVLFLRLGMSTRIIEYLSSEDFFRSNGRNTIIQKLTDAISHNPVFGYGIASDRVITGSYAHNFFLELLTSFGVIFGTVIFVLVLYIIIKSWRSTSSIETKTLLLVLFCVGFLKLFISSSYLMEGMFFLFIGVCVKQIRQRRNNEEELLCQ